MKLTTVKKLQDEFVGKVCTVLTTGIAKPDLQDVQFAQFFTGMVDAIDEDGVWVRQMGRSGKNFFAMPYVVSISEEEVETLDPSEPEHAKVIEKIKSQTGQINLDDISEMAKKAQDIQKTMVRKT
jgi:hypothetical protein